MARFVFANRISALITATLSSSDSTVQLEAGAGALLPVLAEGEIIRATLIDPSGVSEIVNGILIIGDVVTLQRGQEGTPVATFAVGSRFEMRLTAGIADNFLQRSGGIMTGPIDMANNEIKRAVYTTPQIFDTIHVRLLRSSSIPPEQPFNGATENTINIPPNSNTDLEARRPRYLGRPITNAQMFDNIIFDYQGDINNLPSHLKLCNGANGTPDLRGRFCRGWNPTFGVGSVGGADLQSTTPSGAHNHGGATASFTLAIEHIPSHTHTYIGNPGTGGTEGSGGLGGAITRSTGAAGGGAPHAHAITGADNHSHNVTVLPAFYSVAKVVFTV